MLEVTDRKDDIFERTIRIRKDSTERNEVLDDINIVVTAIASVSMLADMKNAGEKILLEWSDHLGVDDKASEDFGATNRFHQIFEWLEVQCKTNRHLLKPGKLEVL